MNLNIRKEELKQIALTHKGAGSLVYQLINDFSLDDCIKKITDVKTKTNTRCLHPNGYLTGNEQFVEVLCEFIYYFETQFSIIGKYSFIHLADMLESKKPKFLLCKNYWGNNDFINYYTFNMKQLIVENFYNNIKFLWTNSELQSFFKKHGITNKMTLKNSTSVNILYNLLQELVWCCKGDYCSIMLFSDHSLIIKHQKEDYPNRSAEELTKSNFDFYSTQYSILVDRYEANIDVVKAYLEA